MIIHKKIEGRPEDRETRQRTMLEVMDSVLGQGETVELLELLGMNPSEPVDTPPWSVYAVEHKGLVAFGLCSDFGRRQKTLRDRYDAAVRVLNVWDVPWPSLGRRLKRGLKFYFARFSTCASWYRLPGSELEKLFGGVCAMHVQHPFELEDGVGKAGFEEVVISELSAGYFYMEKYGLLAR